MIVKDILGNELKVGQMVLYLALSGGNISVWFADIEYIVEKHVRVSYMNGAKKRWSNVYIPDKRFIILKDVKEVVGQSGIESRFKLLDI